MGRGVVTVRTAGHAGSLLETRRPWGDHISPAFRITKSPQLSGCLWLAIQLGPQALETRTELQESGSKSSAFLESYKLLPERRLAVFRLRESR